MSVATGDYQEHIQERVVNFLADLKAAHMRREDAVIHGYRLVLAILRGYAEAGVKAGELISNRLDSELMEQAGGYVKRAMIKVYG